MSFFYYNFTPEKVFRCFRKVWKNCFSINLNAHFFKQKDEEREARVEVIVRAKRDKDSPIAEIGHERAKWATATDGVKYPKNTPADESYLDEQPSYASNEVAINWNVTLFALSAGIDALQ